MTWHFRGIWSRKSESPLCPDPASTTIRKWARAKSASLFARRNRHSLPARKSFQNCAPERMRSGPEVHPLNLPTLDARELFARILFCRLPLFLTSSVRASSVWRHVLIEILCDKKHIYGLFE